MTRAIPTSAAAMPAPGGKTIDEGFIATMVDGGPALFGIVLASVQLAIIGWGIYADIVTAFVLAERAQFVTLVGMAAVILSTSSYILGRLAEAPHSDCDSDPTAEHEAHATAAVAAAASASEQEHSETEHALRTRFFSEVANELRTPITSICLAARIIRKHHLTTPEVVERFGDTLVADANRLGELVNEFLELVRLESGCVAWRDEDVPVYELMLMAESYVAELAQLQERHILLHADAGLPALHCDRERIVQVLTVLLSSALGSSTAGTAIGLYAFGHHGDTVFTISPEGRKPFASKHGATTAETGHSWGLGESVGFGVPALTLNICREIIGHYGGKLTIDDRSDNSNMFRVSLPQDATSDRSDTVTLDDANMRAADDLTPARPMVLANDETDQRSAPPSAPPDRPLRFDEGPPPTRSTPEEPAEQRGTPQRLEPYEFDEPYELGNPIELDAPREPGEPTDEDEPTAAAEDSQLSQPTETAHPAVGPTRNDTLAAYRTDQDRGAGAASGRPQPAGATDSSTEVLITPPPCPPTRSVNDTAALMPPASLPLLPAPANTASRADRGLPILYSPASPPSISSNRAYPTPPALAAPDTSGDAAAQPGPSDALHAAMLEPPIAGVRADEPWHAAAANPPARRAPAPWLAERLRHAAERNTGATCRHGLDEEVAATAQTGGQREQHETAHGRFAQLRQRSHEDDAPVPRPPRTRCAPTLRRRRLGG